MRTLRLPPSEREALTKGALALGIKLESDEVDRLAEFAALLETWSARMNLISCQGPAELVERHLLDSLALVPHVVTDGAVADLGSGAGFPGVPLAVVQSGTGVLLVESRRRRANFLRAVKRELRMDRMKVLEQRAETGPPGDGAQIKTVVCRAVWPDAEILHVAADWLGIGGRLLWMRTDGAGAGEVDERFHRVGVESYRVGTAGPRAIHIFERR